MILRKKPHPLQVVLHHLKKIDYRKGSMSGYHRNHCTIIHPTIIPLTKRYGNGQLLMKTSLHTIKKCVNLTVTISSIICRGRWRFVFSRTGKQSCIMGPCRLAKRLKPLLPRTKRTATSRWKKSIGPGEQKKRRLPSWQCLTTHVFSSAAKNKRRLRWKGFIRSPYSPSLIPWDYYQLLQNSPNGVHFISIERREKNGRRPLIETGHVYVT